MTVKIIIKDHNLHLSQRLEDHVTSRASKLDRYLPELTEAQVDLENHDSLRSATDRHVAQITIRTARGTILRAEESDADIYAAFDRALDKLERQIERYKGKRSLRRGAAPGAPKLIDQLEASAVAEAVEDEQEDESPYGVIVRTKRFVTVPMTPDEALEQMQMLGHDNFFVFFNAEDSRVNVLYRRRDGSYGLIVPELG